MKDRIEQFALLVLAWVVSTAANAQVKEAVQSFTATAPDTVVQTQLFDVTYTLSATTWDKGKNNMPSGRGFSLESLSYAVNSGHPYRQLQASASFVTSRAGMVEIPAMTVEVNKQPVTSAPKYIYVKPHPQYGKEMAFAHEWLLKHGQHPDSICLRMAADDDGFWLFSDRRNHCFCLMAKSEVWPLVGQPVLAYSTETAINGFSDKNYDKMVEPYRQQIAALQLSAGKATLPADSLPYTPRNQAVSPLLGDLRWGQTEPYNCYSPRLNGETVIVGCVPLAVAMVMNYYQWPEQGQSQIYYQPNSTTYRMDFTQCKPQWNTYKKQYQKEDTAEVANLSKLLTALGVSFDATYGTGGTTASLVNVKHVLCNNLQYSGRAVFYYKNLSDSELIAYLYREIDQQRPCIVTNEGHAFVCDGYQGEFLHYNMGWFGFYNGFYRLKLGNYSEEAGAASLLLLKGVLGGIEPRRTELPNKIVALKDAGTLADLLSDEEKENLTSLTVSGPINGADVMLLRKMAGAVAEESPFNSWRGGSLRELNLEQAVIVSDDQPYLTQKATGSRYKTSYKTDESGFKFGQKTVTFNFETMTEAEWKRFKNTMGVKFEGMFYTRTDDNKYWANYTTSKHTIGRYMFANCSSLHRIVLPEQTRKIDAYAFIRCASLQHIRIPKSIQETGQTPFSGCVSLEEVEVPKGFIPRYTLCEKCSPILKGIKHY